MLKALSIFAYFGMVGALIGLMVMRTILSPSPIVVCAQAGAVLLFLWARLTLRWRSFHVMANPTEGGLVTWGPYRYIRHPIYTAFLVFVAAGIAAHWSWSTAALGI